MCRFSDFSGHLQWTEKGLPNILDRIARTTYVDAVYCHRPNSVVCRSVGLSVILASPAKTDEPIEMPLKADSRTQRRDSVSLLLG